MQINYCGTVIFLTLLLAFTAKSQDTLTLSLQNAETRFLQENLILMAERLNIDVKDAQIRQALMWENPEFTIEHQIINREEAGLFGFTNSDNTVFEIEQLIQIGGKRGRKARLLELEKVHTEHKFDLLLREFKRTLREAFFRLAFINRIEGMYHQQIDALDRILMSFEEQFERGNIARLEVMRIRSLLLELEQEYSEVLSDQHEAQNILKILLQLQEEVPLPQLPQNIRAATIQQNGLEISELNELAMVHRSDYRAALAANDAAHQLLRFERSNAVPDVEVGLVHDRFDGPIDNYFGLSLNFPLAFWNRNQGNIQIARHQILQTDLVASYQRQGITHEIAQTLTRYERATHLINRLDDTFEEDFSTIIEVLLRQYQQGDIRLIEFIDFYESFRDGVKRNYSIQEEYLQAVEELNFTVGRDIFQFNF